MTPRQWPTFVPSRCFSFVAEGVLATGRMNPPHQTICRLPRKSWFRLSPDWQITIGCSAGTIGPEFKNPKNASRLPRLSSSDRRKSGFRRHMTENCTSEY